MQIGATVAVKFASGIRPLPYNDSNGFVGVIYYESNFISETEKLFEIADCSSMIRYEVYIFFVNVWDFN